MEELLSYHSEYHGGEMNMKTCEKCGREFSGYRRKICLDCYKSLWEEPSDSGRPDVKK
jgi:hypothetical protein